MTKIDRDILNKTLAGYEEVNRITDMEGRVRLRHLSDTEAREAFDSFYKDRAILTLSDNSSPEEFRLEHHLLIRKAMEKLARRMGFESSI